VSSRLGSSSRLRVILPPPARAPRVLAIAAMLVLMLPAAAHAVDAEVERATALLDAGDAPGALRVITHIDARTDLPAGDLVGLLVARARAHAALGDGVALAADARLLVAVAPSWQAPADAPEALRAALDEARIAQPHPPELDVDVYPVAGGARIVIEYDDDVGAVRSTRLSWRLAGERTWHRSRAAEQIVRGMSGSGIDYHVEALGPGGVVVARSGTEASPEHTSVPTTEADTTGGLGTMTPGDADSTPIWLIAGGVVVAAVVLVLVLVVAGQSSDRTDLGVPIVEWP
jgi:hypothetical protein